MSVCWLNYSMSILKIENKINININYRLIMSGFWSYFLESGGFTDHPFYADKIVLSSFLPSGALGP